MESHGVLQKIGAMPVEAQCFCLALICCYLLPTIVAFTNRSKSRWDILLVNVILGWSVIFWFLTMVSAVSGPKKQPD